MLSKGPEYSLRGGKGHERCVLVSREPQSPRQRPDRWKIHRSSKWEDRQQTQGPYQGIFCFFYKKEEIKRAQA